MQYRNFPSAKYIILVGKISTIQHAIVKFVRLFQRQSFARYGTPISCMHIGSHAKTPLV